MKILSFAPFQIWQVHHQLDRYVLKALMARGQEVVMVNCVGLFANYGHCILHMHGADEVEVTPERQRIQCQECFIASSASAEETIRQVFLDFYLTNEDRYMAEAWMKSLPVNDSSEAKWKNWDIGAWVISTALTKTRSLRMDTPEFNASFKALCRIGLLCALAFERILDKEKPDYALIFNGRFAPYRIAWDLTRARNIRALSHERGAIDDTFMLTYNETFMGKFLHSSPPTEQWMDIPLSARQCLEVENYLSLRERGQGMNWPTFSRASLNDSARLRFMLKVPCEVPILALFPSTPYELESFSDNFSRKQSNLIHNLIRTFARRREWLVIRLHPNFTGDRPQDTDFHSINFFSDLQKKAPPNVRFVFPDENISTYALLENSSGVIAFASSVAYEAQAQGIPSASAITWIRSATEMLITEADIKDPGNLIDQLLARSIFANPQFIARAYRHIYLTINRTSNKFTSFGIKLPHGVEKRFTTVKDLTSGNDPALDHICDHVINRVPFYVVPPAIPNTEEREYLSLRSLGLSIQRSALREKRARRAQLELPHPVTIIALKSISGGSSRVQYDHEANLLSCDRGNAALLQSIASVETSYLTFSTPQVLHLPLFLTSLIQILQSDINLTLNGVRHGAWVHRPFERIYTERYTKRSLTNWHKVEDPWALLSLGVYRTEFFKNWYTKLSCSQASVEFWEAVVTLFHDQAIAAPAIPSAIWNEGLA